MPPPSMGNAATVVLNRGFCRHYSVTGEAHVDRCIDPSYVDRTPLSIPGLASGIDGARQVYAINQAAFSEPWHSIEGQVAEGNLKIPWLTAGDRRTGELLGVAATGKDVSMRGVTIFEVVDEKIVSRWGISDLLDLFVRLGAVPPPGG